MRQFKSASMTALAVPLMLLATPGLAQAESPAADSNSGIQDIVVTATRQATNLQDTPIAITAVTSEALEERGITSVGDLSSVVPNSQFQKSHAVFGPGVSATIRGVGQGDSSLAVEPAVAFYLDDVYYPLLLGSNFDLLEIDHIEVLRGPQGTLFGRNSLAGAVNVVSKQPALGETSGRVQLTAGEYNRRELRASVNLPLGNTMALSLSGLTKKRTGYQRMLDFTCEMARLGTPALSGSLPYSSNELRGSDNCTIGHQGGEDVQAYRASLLWEPASNVRITLTGDYIQDDSEAAANSLVDVLTTSNNANTKAIANYFGIAYDDRFIPENPYDTYATYSDPIAAGTIVPGNSFYNGYKINGVPVRGGASFDPNFNVKNWGISGKISWDITDNINLLAVVSHREVDSLQNYDDDGSPLFLTGRNNRNTEDYWTAEARLSGTSDFIDWVAGVFYFTAKGRQEGVFIAPSSGLSRKFNHTFDPTSKAAFANATIRPFGEKLSITGGLRYSEDEKVVHYRNLVDTTPNAAQDTIFDVTPSQKRVDWKAGLSYQATPDALIYASAASGNSLPGFNSRAQQVTQVYQFDGNENIAYELGTKLDLFDRRVRLNIAAFYTDFKNRPTTISGSEAQLDTNGNPVPGNQILIPLPGGPPGSTVCSTETLPGNTGITCTGRTFPINQPATVRGFEAEYTFNPIDGLVINGSVGWSKLTGADIDARSVNKRQFNPFWTANSGIQYTLPVNALAGTITPRFDWSYQSSEIISGTSTKFNYLTPARSVFNGRLTYQNEDYDFSIAVGATNLFNKMYYVNVFNAQSLGTAYQLAQPAAPRQWYITVEKQF